MALVGVIDILSTLDTSGLKKGLKEASSDISGFVGKFSAVSGSIAAVGAAIGATAIVGGIQDAAFASTELIDSTTDAAARLGTSVKSLTELRYAAKYLGVETESLDSALQKFSVNLGGAEEDTSKTGQALKRLGLDAKSLATEDPAQALKQVVGAFGKLPDQAAKSAVAMQLFGKGGVAILPFLSAGEKGIGDLIVEANKLGITFDDLAGATIGDMKDGIDKLKDTLMGVSNELLVELSPAITYTAQSFIGFVKAVGGAKKIGQTLIDAFPPKQAFDAAYAGFHNLTGIVKQYAGVVDGDAPKAEIADDGSAAKAKRLADMQAQLDIKVAEVTIDLQKQVDTFGKSAEEIKLWELAQQGASKATLQQASALIEQKKHLEEQKKLLEELKSTAKSMVEASLTPYEKQQKEIGKVNELLERGLITQADYQKLINKIGKEGQKTIDAAVGAKLTPKEKFDQRKAELDSHLAEGTIDGAGYARGLKDANEELVDAGKSLTGAALNPLEAYVKRRKELLKGLEDQTINATQFNRGITDARKDFESAVKSIVGDVEKPQEAYLRKMQELQKGLAEGWIDQKTFDKAHATAFDDFQHASGNADPKFAGALQAGSAEARSQMLKFTYGSTKDPFNELTDNGKKQVQLQNDTVSVLKSIDSKLTKSTDLPEIDF